MAKKLISIDDSAAAGSRLPSAVRTELAAVPAISEKITAPTGGSTGQVLAKAASGYTWATPAAGTGVATIDRGEAVMSRIRLKTGDNKIGIIGDSTGNSPTEWADLHATYLAAKDTDRRCEILHWNETTQAMDAATVVQPGIAGASAGVVFHDTFTRTATEIVGSTPDVGPAWIGDSSNSSGDWSLDGTAALRTADATNGYVVANGGVDANSRVTFDFTVGAATGGGDNQSRYAFRYLNTQTLLWVFISITNSGSATAFLRKTIANVTTTITQQTFTIDTASSAAPVSLVCEVVGDSVTVTVNGTVITATLTADDLAALAGSTKAAFGYGRAGNRMLEFKMETTNQVTARLLRVYNASQSGSTLAYQQSRLATMLPESLDLVYINSCHNYSSDTIATYIPKVEEFVTALRTVQPTASIVISSQNLRRSPADNIAAHVSRMSALKSYAVKRGYGYLPVAEAWASSAADPASLMLADGIHPSTGANSGSVLWAGVANAYMDAR
ncbi:SGNH/GDSL hydrolase family protein [Rhodococcus sp. 14-1411-2a]|uniref:SGNH/GDSL hydrolase family protein n=1 Tax=Rhodococcus sp. 14-1411-2a TaxID=2023151 RepID=UPI000B9B77AD|nr:SGNH/GDSL hydrolase family protein [Rhodococcus sp. 14-1411-2a]OZF51282.1 hypothetical protein CH291_06870 [Rhodococcus sp. 14-1411-2a]